MNHKPHPSGIRSTEEVPFEAYDTHMRLSKTEVEWIMYMRQLKTCARKRDYSTEEEAMRVAVYRLTCKDRPESLQPYRCPVCNFWHLTRTKQ